MVTLRIKFYSFVYDLIRNWPGECMKLMRAKYYTLLGLKIGRGVRISIGAKIDVYDKCIPFGIGKNVFIGERTVVSGGVFIGDDVSINSNVSISASKPTHILIGNDCLIGHNVVLRADDHVYNELLVPIRLQGKIGNNIKLGENCWIGANSIILKGVDIGAHSIVCAGALVTKSFPSYSIIAGVPARLINKRN